MAELAASIIGIISAGTKVTLVLSQLASDIGSAGQEARMISSEIRTFCIILGTLKDTMEKIEGSSYYAHCFDMMRGMTDASANMFTEILDAAEALRDMITGKDGRDGKFTFVSKVQWVIFQKPKILVLRAAIEAYKSNIALMLGTINTLEKVARRTSLPQLSGTLIQDNQEQTSLQNLELDCRSSILSLEQVEHQYDEYILRSSGEPIEPPVQHPLLDAITETELLVINKRISDSDHLQEILIDMAREDVNSIRSSLAHFSAQEGSLQAQIVRHSQRLSKLLETDRQRLSQSWSKFVSTIVDNVPEAVPIVHSALPRDITDKHQEPEINFGVPGQGAVYLAFRTWLLEQPWSDQDKIVEALRADVLTDRLPKDISEGSQAAVVDVEEWLGDTNPVITPYSASWTRPGTEVAQTSSTQAQPRTVVAPTRETEPIQSKNVDHGLTYHVRPILEAEDLLAPPSSTTRIDALNHRRSRSHGVLDGSGGTLHTGSVSRNRVSDQTVHRTNTESGEMPTIVGYSGRHFPKGPPIPPKQSILDMSRWERPLPKFISEQLSPTSLFDNASSRSQPPLVATPRKEKRYSMLIAKDVSTPRAQTQSPVHGSLKEYMESMGATFPTPMPTAAESHEMYYK